MDAAWAVVVGAAIAAIATFAGSPVTAWLADRRQRANTLDDQRREAVDEALMAIFDRATAVSPQERADSLTRAMRAGGRLGLFVRPGESKVVPTYLSMSSKINDDPDRKGLYVGVVAQNLPAWYRGDISYEEFVAACNENRVGKP